MVLAVVYVREAANIQARVCAVTSPSGCLKVSEVCGELYSARADHLIVFITGDGCRGSSSSPIFQ